MNRKIPLIGLVFPVAILPLLLLNSHSNGPLQNSNLLRVTGAPGEYTCNYCHTQYPDNSGLGTLTLDFGNDPYYLPGQTYTITLTQTGSTINMYGFQLTALDTVNQRAGTFLPVAGTDTFFINQRQYIEHNTPGSTGSWTFQWVAPQNNAGDITFYAATVAAQYPTGTSGDRTYSVAKVFPALQQPVAGLQASDTVVCRGNQVQFTNLSQNDDSRAWYFEGGSPAMSTLDDPVVTYTNPGQFQVKLVVSNPLGSDSVAQDVSCFGYQNGSLSFQPAAGAGPFSYQWSNGQTASAATNLQAGISYCVTVTDSKGCSASFCGQVSQPQELTATANATPSHAVNPDGSIDLTVSGGTPPYAFLWSTSDTAEDLQNLYAGTYHVTITDHNQCSKTLNIEVPLATGVRTLSAASLKIYPNPARESVTVSGLQSDRNYTLTVFNIAGNRVRTEKLKPGQDTFILHLNSLPPGSYFLEIQSAGDSRILPFQVQ